MNTKYDPTIVQAAADALYLEARTVVRNTMIKCGFVAFIFGFMAGAFFSKGAGGVLPLVLAIFFCVIGVAFGQSAAAGKAFQLRLTAQVALCQVQIESNTQKVTSELVA